MAKSHSLSNQFQSIFYLFWWRKIYEIHSNLRIVGLISSTFFWGEKAASPFLDVFFPGSASRSVSRWTRGTSFWRRNGKRSGGSCHVFVSTWIWHHGPGIRDDPQNRGSIVGKHVIRWNRDTI